MQCIHHHPLALCGISVSVPSPHSIHAGVVMRFHRCSLALCGNAVSELNANLSTCSVTVEIVADQSCGALLSSRSGRFCLDRLVL